MSRPKGSKNKPKTKTQLIQKLAKKQGLSVTEIKISTQDPTDILGLPVLKRGRPKKVEVEVPVKAKRGRPAKVVVVSPKRGRPAGSKNKQPEVTSVIQVTSKVGQVTAKRGRKTLLKNLPFEEKLKAILCVGASDLFQDIINRKKVLGRPKVIQGSVLSNSLKKAILKDAEL